MWTVLLHNRDILMTVLIVVVLFSRRFVGIYIAYKLFADYEDVVHYRLLNGGGHHSEQLVIAEE